MRARKNKRNIFFRKSSWLLIVIFIATLITIPSFTTKTEAAVREVAYTDTDYLKILEIEPGADSFILDNDGNTSTKEREVKTVVNGKNIIIVRISMAEFISMVDEIKGQYDAIVIGRKNTNLDTTFSVSKQYRDYTGPFSQEVEGTLFYAKNSKNSGFILDNNTLPEEDRGKQFIEYYSENDITNKRAKEITAMINSKELVYIDNSILSLTTTKLYSNFNSISAGNFKKKSQNEITIASIIDDYSKLMQENKRPIVSKLTISADDENVALANVSSDTKNMELKVTTNEKNLIPKLFLDINADAIYTEGEEAEGITYTTSESGSEVTYTIKYSLDRSFVGYLDWKIELARGKDDNAVKTYVTNHSEYKPSDKIAKIIKVLQIHPTGATDTGNLYLCPVSNDTNPQAQKSFNSTLTNSNLEKLGYKLIIDAMSCEAFNSKANSEVNKADKDKLLAKYDMVIIGFSDSYSNDQFYANATKELDKFIKDGKAALFTHDTMTLNTFGGDGIDMTNWNGLSGPKLLGQTMRDYLGQARYVDYKKSYTSDLKSDDFDKTKIDHDPIIPTGTIGASKYTMSSTLYSMGTTLYANGQNDINQNYKATDTTDVCNINSAQITSYPFNLTSKNLKVTNTHTQWFQLNLEDPEVVPWYNLSKGTKFDDGDSRNFYYTYSRGNITYSGTGHSSTAYNLLNSDGTATYIDEFQLFINTIIKAYRGANYKPEIFNKTISNEDINDGATLPEVQRNVDYDFISIPRDLNDKNLFVTITADGQSVYEVKEDGTLVNGIVDSLKPREKAIKVRIPKAIYGSKSQITVTTTVKDPVGELQTKTFIIKISSNVAPTITNKYLNKTEIGNNTTIPDKVLKTSDYEFITMPNDGNDAKVDVTMTADGQPIYEMDNNGNNVTTSSKTSNQEIKVKIPKGYYENKSQITVTTKVMDAAGAFDIKTFILKINQPPTIKNYNLDNKEFTDQILADTVVKRTDAYYDFISIPSDTDDNQVDVTMTVDGQPIYEVDTNGNNITTSNKTSNQQIKVRIPKTIYEYKNEITVTTTVTDKMGVYETKTFKLKVSSNSLPTIKNYYLANYDTVPKEIVTGTKVDGTKDYEFYSVPKDEEDKQVYVTITADGQEVYDETGAVIKESMKDTDNKIKARIPQSVLANKTSIIVQTTVKDLMGYSHTEAFTLNINEKPTITNRDIKDKPITSDNIVPIVISGTDNYDFISLPTDKDDETVKVTITAAGQDVMQKTAIDSWATGINTKDEKSGTDILVRIPKKVFEDEIAKGNKEITVVTTVVDAMGLSDSKSFKIRINEAPSINNYYKGAGSMGQGTDIGDAVINEVSRTMDYDFISIPTDPNDKAVKVTITVDGVYLNQVTTDAITNKEVLLPINGSDTAINTGIKVRIPKEILINKVNEGKDEITVTTTVMDIMGLSQTKQFTVKIKNEAPTITNYDKDGINEIKSGDKITVTRIEDFNFKTEPIDPEGRPMTVTFQLDDGTVISNLTTITGAVSGEKTGNIVISKDYFVGKQAGDEIEVTVTAKDDKGNEVSKAFTLVITNLAPTITNRDLEDKPITSDNIVSIIVNGNDNYDFISLPTDKDDETVKVTITAAGQDVMQKTAIDSWATGINTKDEKSGTDILVRIPKKVFEDEIAKGNKKITVVTTVVDEMGSSDSKSFEIRINEAPSINNYYKGAGSMGQGTDIGDAVINEVSRTMDYDFISIPTDPNDSQVKVTITVDGKCLNQVTTNEMTNEEVLLPINQINTAINTGIKVRIPKEILIDKMKAGIEEITVTTKVEDIMGLSQTKQFTVKIKNEAPTITNYDEDGIKIIKLNQEIPVTRIEDFNFKTEPIDPEGRPMTVTFQLDDGTVISNLTTITGAVSGEKTGNIVISKDYFVSKQPGDTIDVTVTAEDDKGNKESKAFTLIIENLAPTIVNYDNNGTDTLSSVNDITVSKTANYEFKTLPIDPEGKPLTLKVTLKDGTVISTTSDATSGIKAQLEIPKAQFVGKIPGEKIEITVTARDEDGGEASQGFTLVIGNIDPIVTHILDGTDAYNYFLDSNSNKLTDHVYYFKKLEFVGNITKVYNKNATVTLKLDDNVTTGENIKLIGEVSVEMVNSDGNIIPLGSMTGSNGSYSYALSNYDINTIPDEGIKLRVKYSAEIYKLPPETEKSYKNMLSIENINTPVIIKTLTPNSDIELF